ncbi:MAG: glycosyl hydrolase 53 family protein [Gammaproteobacteria bacterium]|nr:glycosyl hydrolase 53 family protein [Gammaproteobacteria bacterium]
MPGKVVPALLISILVTVVTGCGGGSHSNNSNSPQDDPGDTSGLAHANYILGADISSIPERIDGGALFIDTDGIEKNLLVLLKNYGFNFIRLRTFVNPSAQYGYASNDSCTGKSEAYNDKDHIVNFAQEVKAAGMGLLLDFHYSDTWADPQKQVIPEAWRGLSSIDALAAQVKAYTVEVIEALVAVGATPDIVQIGNEITPGMLIHIPTIDTDCYGNNSIVNVTVNGSTANWDNFAALLRAGIEGVHQADANIQIMLHIENTEDPNGIINWVENIQSRNVVFDILGLSAYEQWQGPSSAWRATLQTLANHFPDLTFAIAEYNPQRRLLNEIMRDLPNARGLGTFIWEPTQSVGGGDSLFTQQGNTYTAKSLDFAEFDQIRDDFGL